MSVQWQSIESYPPDTWALFWIDEGNLQFAVFGIIERRGAESDPHVWDDNDFGYGPVDCITHWAQCTRPSKQLN